MFIKLLFTYDVFIIIAVFFLIQIYIGTTIEALSDFSPPDEGAWLIAPGGVTELACGATNAVLHFKGKVVVGGPRLSWTGWLLVASTNKFPFILMVKEENLMSIFSYTKWL